MLPMLSRDRLEPARFEADAMKRVSGSPIAFSRSTMSARPTLCV
jgi:hypothetical protein